MLFMYAINIIKNNNNNNNTKHMKFQLASMS